MANIKTCDRCGETAVTEMKFETSSTTPIKADLCESCLAKIKQVMRIFTGQELGELEVDAQRPIQP